MSPSGAGEEGWVPVYHFSSPVLFCDFEYLVLGEINQNKAQKDVTVFFSLFPYSKTLRKKKGSGNLILCFKNSLK